MARPCLGHASRRPLRPFVHTQGFQASLNVWECYEIWEKKFQDWKFYGNLQNVLEMYKMSCKHLKCPGYFLEMVKGANSAPKCLEFTSEHLGTPKLLGPLAGPVPPAFLSRSQFQIFSQGTYLNTIAWCFAQNSKLKVDIFNHVEFSKLFYFLVHCMAYFFVSWKNKNVS